MKIYNNQHCLNSYDCRFLVSMEEKTHVDRNLSKLL